MGQTPSSQQASAGEPSRGPPLPQICGAMMAEPLCEAASLHQVDCLARPKLKLPEPEAHPGSPSQHRQSWNAVERDWCHEVRELLISAALEVVRVLSREGPASHALLMRMRNTLESVRSLPGSHPAVVRFYRKDDLHQVGLFSVLGLVRCSSLDELRRLRDEGKLGIQVWWKCDPDFPRLNLNADLRPPTSTTERNLWIQPILVGQNRKTVLRRGSSLLGFTVYDTNDIRTIRYRLLDLLRTAFDVGDVPVKLLCRRSQHLPSQLQQLYPDAKSKEHFEVLVAYSVAQQIPLRVSLMVLDPAAEERLVYESARKKAKQSKPSPSPDAQIESSDAQPKSSKAQAKLPGVEVKSINPPGTSSDAQTKRSDAQAKSPDASAKSPKAHH